MPVEVRDEGADFHAGRRGDGRRINTWSRDRDHPQPIDPSRCLGIAGDDTAQERLPDARPTHRDDDHPLVRVVPELLAQLLSTLQQRCRIKPGYVPTEGEVAFRPVTDRRQTGAEVVGHDVVGFADEDRSVPKARETLDMFDHLGVVVGGQKRLAFATRRHRQPSDEVGHPRERRALQLRVLVEEMVDVPRLVADHEVVLAGLDDIVEDHEVRDEDLVHAADGLEGVQVVLGRFGRDVRGLRGELCAHGVDPLAVRLQDGGDRMLCEPVDLDVGAELAQLVRDGDVALGVAEADRGGDVERASPARQGARPVAWLGRAHECGHDSVLPIDRTKSRMSRLASTGWRPGIMWSAPSTTTSGALVSSDSRRDRATGWQVSSEPWMRSIGQRTPRHVVSIVVRSQPSSTSASASIASTDPSSAHSTASAICFVEWGSDVISSKKKRANPA